MMSSPPSRIPIHDSIGQMVTMPRNRPTSQKTLALVKRAERLSQQNRNRFVITRRGMGTSGRGIPLNNYYYHSPSYSYNPPNMSHGPSFATYYNPPSGRDVPHMVILDGQEESDCSITIPFMEGAISPTGVADLKTLRPNKPELRSRPSPRGLRRKEHSFPTTRRMSRHSSSAFSTLNDNVEIYTEPGTDTTEHFSSQFTPMLSYVTEKVKADPAPAAVDQTSTQANHEQQQDEEDKFRTKAPLSTPKTPLSIHTETQNEVVNAFQFFFNPLSCILSPCRRNSQKENIHSNVEEDLGTLTKNNTDSQLKTSQSGNKSSGNQIIGPDALHASFRALTMDEHDFNDDDISTISVETSYEISFAETNKSSAILDLKLRKRKMEREFSRKVHKIPSVVVISATSSSKPMSPMRYRN